MLNDNSKDSPKKYGNRKVHAREELRNTTGILHRGQTSVAFFVLFSRILFNTKWKHGQGCIRYQNSLGLSRIVLANGADNSAAHSFQTLRSFLVNFQNV